LLFVLIFALVGSIAFYASQAATLSTMTSQGTAYANYFAVTKNGSTDLTPPTLVDDAIAFNGSIQAAELNAGDTLLAGAKGGDLQGLPKVISRSSCFTMKNMGTTTATVQLVSLYTATNISLKPMPLPDNGQLFWQYNCVKNTKTSGTLYPYNLKVVSGGPVRVYSITNLTEWGY
jgi:hypothetical protein